MLIPNIMTWVSTPPVFVRLCGKRRPLSILLCAINVQLKSYLVSEHADNIITMLFRSPRDRSCLIEDLLNRKNESIFQPHPALRYHVSSGLIILPNVPFFFAYQWRSSLHRNHYSSTLLLSFSTVVSFILTASCSWWSLDSEHFVLPLS